MGIPPEFSDHIAQKLSDFFKQQVIVTGSERLYGGDINDSFVLHSSSGNFFLKINSTLKSPDFFEKEARGLIELRSTGCIQIPQPLFAGQFKEHAYLTTEYIEKGNPGQHFWEDFGTSIANLHRVRNNEFGLSYDNYIGSLVQSNRQKATWAVFYAEERIMKLAEQAAEKGRLMKKHIRETDILCAKLKDIIPSELPSLLHGDLWSGNFMVTSDGGAAIFDPAIYYGHREIDLAMAGLFGGFDKKFYQSYHAAYPLQPGWAERMDIFQLYPLLVHSLLFGGHFVQSFTSILSHYC